MSWFTRFTLLVVIVLIVVFPILYMLGYGSFLPGYHALYYTPQKYKKAVENVVHVRNGIRQEYTKAFIDSQREHILKQAGDTLAYEVERKIIPFWYGTGYDFNGHTEIPGKGKIACGYFVTAVLFDAGLPIDRNHLAQVASEEMVKGLVGEEQTQRFQNTNIADFLHEVRKQGDGLYVVGLDTHTGFLLNHHDNVDFIHASARFPSAVIREDALDSPTLSYSKYRVLGKLSDNPILVAQWLNVPPPVTVRDKRLRENGLLRR
jgi:hypothetical protein